MFVTNFSPPALQLVARWELRSTKEDSITWIMEQDPEFMPSVHIKTFWVLALCSVSLPFFQTLKYTLVKGLQRSSFRNETLNDNRRKLLIITREAAIITNIWLRLRYAAILEESTDTKWIKTMQPLLHTQRTKQSTIVLLFTINYKLTVIQAP